MAISAQQDITTLDMGTLKAHSAGHWQIHLCVHQSQELLMCPMQEERWIWVVGTCNSFDCVQDYHLEKVSNLPGWITSIVCDAQMVAAQFSKFNGLQLSTGTHHKTK